MTELIHDDCIIAIKTCFNARHFISSLKLLVSFIDTMAYATYGESSPGNFRRWLDTYARLETIGITADELWEHRNSLLHVTGLDSRKVIKGTVHRLVPYLGPGDILPRIPAGEKWYSLYGLLMVIMSATNKLIDDLGNDPGNLGSFLSRYGSIVSDTNCAVIGDYLKQPGEDDTARPATGDLGASFLDSTKSDR